MEITQTALMSKLDGSLESLIGWLEAAGEFVTEQAPLVVQEILLWGLLKNGLEAGILLATSVVLMTVVRSAFWDQSCKQQLQRKEEGYSSNTDFGSFCAAFAGVSTGVGILLLVPGVADLFWIIKILVAPRLYLIEILQSILSVQ